MVIWHYFNDLRALLRFFANIGPNGSAWGRWVEWIQRSAVDSLAFERKDPSRLATEEAPSAPLELIRRLNRCAAPIWPTGFNGSMLTAHTQSGCDVPAKVVSVSIHLISNRVWLI